MNYFCPGSVNTHWGPGPVNTNLVPGPVNTNWGPGLGPGARRWEIQIPHQNVKLLLSSVNLIKDYHELLELIVCDRNSK